MQKKTFVKIVSTGVLLGKRIHQWLERSRIRVYAAQASFFMTISALPMLILVLSLAGMLLPHGNGEVKQRLFDLLPAELGGVVETVLREVEEKANLPLLSMSAATLLWSASRGIRGIGAGIRQVYGGKQRDRFLVYHARYLLYTVLIIAAGLLALGIWVFGDTIVAGLAPGGPARLIRLLNRSAFFILLITVFLLSFRGMAGRSVTLWSQLPGAVFSAGGWLLYSRFFEFYVEHYAGSSYVYGSITSLILVMLWLYACMEILLMGAGLNMVLCQGSGRKGKE